MKKIVAILLVLMLLSLTGCVANRNAATVDESEIDRPGVIVLCGETELAPTVETVDAETGENTTQIIGNSLEAGMPLTLTGKHSSGIKSVSYRFVSGAEVGEVVIAEGSSVDVEIPANATAIELYVTNGNGIVSQWATYYFG